MTEKNFFYKLAALFGRKLAFYNVLLTFSWLPLGFLLFYLETRIDSSLFDQNQIIFFLLLYLPFSFIGGAFIFPKYINKAINLWEEKTNAELINKTNLNSLFEELIQISFKKYKKIHYEINFDNLSDWIFFQSENNRKKPFEELIQKDDSKYLGTGIFVTFDNLPILSSKFLDYIVNTNPIISLLEEGETIEIALTSEFNSNEEHIHDNLRFRLIYHSTIFEILYSVNDDESFNFLSLSYFRKRFSIWSEDHLSNFELAYMIRFTERFIKKTKKYLR